MASQDAHDLPVRPGLPIRIRDVGHDEVWLQNWLSQDPSRLGLGDVTVIAQELSGAPGSLDILAADGDTYYSIEVQLGEVDASHGFRVFDYWARNRARYQDQTHVAVLMAESARGRYRLALESLVELVPLVVIELRAWRGNDEVVIVPEVVFANDRIDIAGTAVSSGGRTETDWRAVCTDEAWRFHEEFVQWARANLGDVRTDYNPKSYVGVRRGRRVWTPLWFTRDGARIYFPDPDGTRAEEPSVAFESFARRLEEADLDPSWQTTYDVGAHPITMRLRRADLAKIPVQDFLRASFEILEEGTEPWSQRHPPTPLDADGSQGDSTDE